MRVLTSKTCCTLRESDESDPACRKNKLPGMNIGKRNSHETIFQSISYANLCPNHVELKSAI